MWLRVVLYKFTDFLGGPLQLNAACPSERPVSLYKYQTRWPHNSEDGKCRSQHCDELNYPDFLSILDQPTRVPLHLILSRRYAICWCGDSLRVLEIRRAPRMKNFGWLWCRVALWRDWRLQSVSCTCADYRAAWKLGPIQECCCRGRCGTTEEAMTSQNTFVFIPRHISDVVASLT